MQIDIHQLTKTFNGYKAIDIDHFHTQPGEMIGVLGNNGAGKTTLFRLMLDLLKADTGAVEMTFSSQGINPAVSEDWKLYTGAFIDSSFLIDFLTPEEYFSFVARISGMAPDEARRRIEGFGAFMNGEIMGRHKLIRSFSAGNRQKIGIMAAMLNHPQLLILDEPFNFLDPSSQTLLERLLADYCRQTGATLLLSSHNVQHTIGASSRVVLLEKGRIIKNLPNHHGSAQAELERYFDSVAEGG